MKSKAIFISGLLLAAFGLGLVAYGNQSVIMEKISEITPHEYHIQYIPPEEKLHISNATTGVGTYIIELTNPPETASIQQDRLILQIQDMGGQILRRYTTTVNAITVNLPRNRIMSLACNPDIKRIYEDRRIFSIPYEENNSIGTNISFPHEYTGKGVMVFVIDTGINGDLPQFQNNNHSVVSVYYSTYNGVKYTHWHGTFCGYIIHEIAPDAELGSICVFDYDGQAWLSDVIDATDYVAVWHRQHPNVFTTVSCSFGISQSAWHGGGWSNPCIVCEAFNSLANMGIPVVVAAGNDGPDTRTINCPGQAQYVLTVGAVDKDKNIAWFSSRGPTTDEHRKPDVVAYGVDIKGIDTKGNDKISSGTSFSTPMVAGVVAQLGEKYGYSYTPKQYYDAIRSSAIDLGEKGYDYDYGYGFVNVTGSFNAMASMTPTKVYTNVGIPIFVIGVAFMAAPVWRRR